MDSSHSLGNKKILLGGIVGVVVLLILCVVAWRLFSGLYSNGDTIPDDPNRTATLSFAQSDITVAPGQDMTLDVVLDTGDISVSAASVVILYDPEALTLNSLLPSNPNLFGTSQEYEITQDGVEAENGQAIFKIKAVDTGAPPTSTRQGNQEIAEAMFTANSGFEGTTSLIFYQNETTPDVSSMVMTQNYDGSILKSTGETTITIK